MDGLTRTESADQARAIYSAQAAERFARYARWLRHRPRAEAARVLEVDVRTVGRYEHALQAAEAGTARLASRLR